jgi:hypothetical protein
MGILDEAIKEHLELKRQHGAGESELKQLEDEAFGAAERPGGEASPPDPLAEAPTEFMTQPEAEAPKEEPAEPAAESPAPPEEPPSRPAPRAEIADLQEAPAEEHEIPSGPSTEEREAIAEQPTEMYDLEEELASSQAEAPSEEDLVQEEIDEPRLAPVDPLAGLEDAEDDGGEVEVSAPAEAEEEHDEDDDFWDEKRLSDELDQALEAPSEAGDEEEVFFEGPAEAGAEPEPEVEEQPPVPGEEARHDEEDVLEETPDFLEETPEDDQLWFEQKPPKDFDFDD